MNNSQRVKLLETIHEEKIRRECEKSLATFARYAWPIIEPGVPYIHGWHIDVICEHLEAVTKGEIRFLLINIPPRHAKSTLVNVLWPCWEWTTRPWEKYLCASYSGILSTRDSIKCRRLITSPWYRSLWNDTFHLTADQNQKSRFENDQTGYRIASSVGGTATGEGGSRLVLDDPHSAQDAQSDAMRESALEWFDTVWSTRLNNPKKDAMVTIMQRLHEKDVSGRILELGGWEHICLPAEYEPVERKTCLGSYDKRTKPGELLWPDRFGGAEIKKLKVQLGAYGSSGQLQQRPSPSGGGIIKTRWFKKWPNKKPIPYIEYLIQSYDTAFTAKTSNDPTALSVWGVFVHENVYQVMLMDCWDDYLEYPELRERVLSDWNSKYGDENEIGNRSKRPNLVLIEEKGSGQSLIQDLRKANVIIAPYNPGKADKVSRAHVVAPILENGLVWIPESKTEGEFATWAKKFLKQVERFPNDEHDDYIDTMTQGLRYLHDQGFIGLKGTRRNYEDEYEKKYKKPRVNPYAI